MQYDAAALSYGWLPKLRAGLDASGRDGDVGALVDLYATFGAESYGTEVPSELGVRNPLEGPFRSVLSASRRELRLHASAGLTLGDGATRVDVGVIPYWIPFATRPTIECSCETRPTDFHHTGGVGLALSVGSRVSD